MSNEEILKVLRVMEQDHRTKGYDETLRYISPELAEWNLGVSDGLFTAIELLQETADISDFL